MELVIAIYHFPPFHIAFVLLNKMDCRNSKKNRKTYNELYIFTLCVTHVYRSLEHVFENILEMFILKTAQRMFKY